MILRAAIAEDADSLAELMYMADQAHYRTSGYAVSLGGTREHQLKQLAGLARAEARSQFHWSHFDVAVTESGMLAASVAGFDRAEAGEQAGSALKQIGWDSAALQGLAERLGPLGGCFPEDVPGSWTIEHVATLPEFR